MDKELDYLKPLVNNPKMWGALMAYLEPHEKQAMGNLLNTTSVEQLWRAQGAMASIKLIKDLKDRVNVQSDRQ